MAAQKATYFNDNNEPKVFDVLTDNKDGTVDIGDATAKTVAVRLVKVTKEPTPGCVVLVEEEKAQAKAPAK